ncbi:ABC transporter substrate-binding protein [Sulfitobacter sp. M57]|uniref:heme/hemin ABC transporter substrate-binding protein n=1 Tax=unclassified Sulfitobacter TaxID=196795 RepID=UPI0023E2A40E|nr:MULTISPECIES: ABC transporter substrate-binding protein [unclassified Sulfitobacter]MDF3415105.1 ABC transporter substrate-binding protein [Sulfitobacter sp. KE5]MDF3422586.1 ABC transporter substrate-binding protein [Sulfitobacter sp. KE43]MDF3433651.1 ABC transporter substrate-binding protein [Sulfitobacter sp. KE42]MDF3459291.1 ABC transporter substrate-binding protein [Sulfitobacter sp. S74]MDF3463190.1 ABC transporter substrate-binding protein [Sulfitobacter sp. Ks18]
MKRLSFRPNPLGLVHGAGIAFFVAAFGWQVHAEQQDKVGNIVSIGGSITEIVYALDQQHRLIARDTTSVYPPEALSMPDVGYVRALSPEGVLSVGPELVIAEEGAGPATAVDVLRKSSIPYVDIPETDSRAGVLEKIHLVGAALGVPERAETLAQKVDADFENAIAAVKARPVDQRRVLFVLSLQGGRILAAGTNTGADAIIGLAGGTNVIQNFAGYKPVTEEAIAAAQPDVILMMERRTSHAGTNDDLWKLPALAQTPAARNEAVVRIDGLLLLGFGPRTPQAISALHSALSGGS